MSVTKQVKEAQRLNGGQKHVKPSDNSGFQPWITLTLTPDEKQFLMGHRDEWGSVESLLMELLEKGCTVKLFWNVEPESIEIVLREKRLLWKEEKQVSFRAKNLDNAVVGMHYAIARHLPGWPYKSTETIEF